MKILSKKGYQEDKADRHNNLVFNAKMGFIIGIPILSILLSIFVFNLYHIEGPSMEPTLRNGDRVIISKLDKTWAKLTGKNYVPKRYDVVVLREPDAKDKIIKRVIGLPGDRIVVRNNQAFVFNDIYPEGLVVDSDLSSRVVINDITAGYTDETLKEGEVFVLGDNREQSVDSRKFGIVSTEAIIGKLLFRVYPWH